MAELISKEQFLIKQPSFPEETVTDGYYHRLANLLAESMIKRKILEDWPKEVIARSALCVTGYIQDVICDSGLWRSFIESHRRMYGKWLPFYEIGEEYVPHELNYEDVRFLLWYSLCMNYEDRRVWNPLDERIEKGAALWYEMLDQIYEEAPEPVDYFTWKGLEMNNPEEFDHIMHFGHWLYIHSYLMSPAFALTLGEILSRPGMKDSDNFIEVQNAIQEAMGNVPTGPLAFFLQEWLYLILENKKISVDEMVSGREEHPIYSKFISATGGSIIKFLENYEAFNDFVIEHLGWTAGEHHLPSLMDAENIVLMVNRYKGMLLARDICKCICLPDNPLYDKTYARDHAIELLTVRGRCPGDLLRYLFDNDALPDARFPDSEDYEAVHLNRDFISRCYLQQYYTGD